MQEVSIEKKYFCSMRSGSGLCAELYGLYESEEEYSLRDTGIYICREPDRLWETNTYRVAVDLRAGYVPGSPGSGYREDHHSVGRGTPSGT